MDALARIAWLFAGVEAARLVLVYLQTLVLTDIGRKYRSAPAWHVRPASTEEVAAVVRVAAEPRIRPGPTRS